MPMLRIFLINVICSCCKSTESDIVGINICRCEAFCHGPSLLVYCLLHFELSNNLGGLHVAILSISLVCLHETFLRFKVGHILSYAASRSFSRHQSWFECAALQLLLHHSLLQILFGFSFKLCLLIEPLMDWNLLWLLAQNLRIH